MATVSCDISISHKLRHLHQHVQFYTDVSETREHTRRAQWQQNRQNSCNSQILDILSSAHIHTHIALLFSLSITDENHCLKTFAQHIFFSFISFVLLSFLVVFFCLVSSILRTNLQVHYFQAVDWKTQIQRWQRIKMMIKIF